MKNFSPVDFYRDALLEAPYPAGVLYLARHIQCDVCLTDSQRTYLMSLARYFYSALNNGRSIYLDL